jgi:hypothetical protein
VDGRWRFRPLPDQGFGRLDLVSERQVGFGVDDLPLAIDDPQVVLGRAADGDIAAPFQTVWDGASVLAVGDPVFKFI